MPHGSHAVEIHPAHTISVAIASIATVVYVVMATPSLVRLARSRRLEGVSTASTELLVLSAVWWVAYAVEIDNIPTLVSSALGLFAPSLSMALLWRMGAVGPWAKAALAGGLALVPLSVFRPDVLASVAAAAGASLAVPQAFALLRHPDRSVAGVSAASWTLVGFNGALWLSYGILVGHPLIGAAGLVTVPTSAVVVATLLRRRA
jgi:uncharacterized protein with PQ loop repeat